MASVAGLELDLSSAASAAIMPSTRPADAARLVGVKKLRADRCPALACLLRWPARFRLAVARTHRADPGGDDGQLGSPRSHLRPAGDPPMPPARALFAAEPPSCVFARPASSTASRSTSSNHWSHSLRSPGRASRRALSRRGSLAPLLGRQHQSVGQPFDHRRPQQRRSPAFSNSPCLSATRQPSRLPLSTVERYREGVLAACGCRTSCRSGPSAFPAGRTSRKSARVAPGGRPGRCNPGRGPPGSRRARARYWSETSGGRSGRRGPPESYRGGASVVVADEGREKVPGLAGDPPQGAAFGIAQGDLDRSPRLADSKSHDR